MTTQLLGNLSEQDRQAMDRIGRHWAASVPTSVEATVALYAPLAAAAPATTATVTRDVSYGPHARHVMDIYAPCAQARQNRPADVMLFFHGGAFVRGAKCVNDQFYDNVCRWFADRGVLAVNVEYRLAGDAPFPGGAQDVGRAVDYLVEHVPQYGGNPTRIFLVGHSAGGSHVASYAYDHTLGANGRALLADDVRGIVLLSARLRADVRDTNPNAHAVRAYFGEDESRYDALSPVSHAAGSRVPTFVAVAQYENPHLDLYGAELFHRLLEAAQSPDGITPDPMPRFVQLMKHNHISIATHFNTGEDLLGEQILDFMQAC